jgi:hypothetical protein
MATDIDIDFLVKAIDSTNPNPAVDIQGCYKRGDIVDVQIFGFVWGNQEITPNFYHLVALNYNKDSEYKKKFKLPYLNSARRLHKVRIDDMPTAFQNDLINTGTLTKQWNSIKNYFRNKQTGQDEN